jgi:hypothetical protein
MDTSDNDMHIGHRAPMCKNKDLQMPRSNRENVYGLPLSCILTILNKDVQIIVTGTKCLKLPLIEA